MRTDKNRIIWAGVRGRNGGDSPIDLKEDEVVEARNVDFYDGALCQKRHGSLDFPQYASTAQYSVVRHQPANSTEALAELLGIADTIGLRLYRPSAGLYTWVAPATDDGVDIDSATDNPRLMGASLNTKCFLAYRSVAVNRLHCWDGTRVRRVGLIVPGAAPTVANTGGGAYAATLRYYKVAWAEISGTTHVRRSELSASVSFTPSGAGTAARVTRPTAAGERETHWLVYASADDTYSNYKLIATVAIATTTYDDSTAPASYTGEAPNIAGINTPPPSVKFIITDVNRLLMAGAYEDTGSTGQTSPKESRVWFTRSMGSSDIGDDESIPNTSAVGIVPAQRNWIDVGESDGGGQITGLAIINGLVFVFKRRHIYRLVRTGDDLVPYQTILVSNEFGCTFTKSLAVGENAAGQPALYFANARGVYRLSLAGDVEFISRQLDDLFTADVTVFSLYHGQRRQLWVRLTAAVFGIYDVARDGWSTADYTSSFTGTGLETGVMFPELELDGTGFLKQTASGYLKPILFGQNEALMGDDPSSTTDPGGNFQAYLQSRPYFPAGLGTLALVHDATLVAKAGSGVTITATVTGDFGLSGSSKTATALLTPAGSETRVIRRLADSGIGGIHAVQYTLGDASAVANYWVLDGLSAPVKAQESLG